jgi:ubiquitin carboxyl-terminal hydrolase 36/42
VLISSLASGPYATYGLDPRCRCDKCKQHVRACRTAGLEVAPNVLTLCLKRFGGQRFGKITRHIRFSDHLDLSKYLVRGGMDTQGAE